MNFFDEAIETKYARLKDRVEHRRMLKQACESGAIEATAEFLSDGKSTPALVYELSDDEIRGLQEAEVYFWEPRVTQLVLASGQQLPSHIKFDPRWMLTRSGWWWFGPSSPLIGYSDGHTHRYVAALLYYTKGDRVHIHTYYREGNRLLALGALSWHTVDTLEQTLEDYAQQTSKIKVTEEDDESGVKADAIRTKMMEQLVEWKQASRNALVTFACGNLWLQQKIIVHEVGLLTRSASRRLERAGRLQDVLVVRLRRKEFAPRPKDGESEPVDWAWQWVVHGHWRDQPTKDGIKLIWIHPFIKGPEDKPLKPTAVRVFDVSR